ncbi:hypothetical protein FAVG1_02881 [Fusarium avenaceum]|nr:hypothetical protein FAVG1_02881 [Fusarium avenaceum]
MANTQGAGQPPPNSNNENKSAPSQTTEKRIRDNVIRLLFELLRNADGKAYSECAARKESPFVTFKIYPKQIIIDCNEDGLNKLDLDAICRLDPKAASFKSILIASKTVHIQSSYFSFEFEHKGEGEKIKPVWVAPVDDFPETLTRLTLHLHDEGVDEDLQFMRDTVLSQFEQLSGTSLLFLRMLQRITVEFYDTDGKLQKSKHFRKEKLDDCRVSIEGISIIEGRQATDSQIYHVAEQLEESLATSVILAFPLDKDYKPTVRHGKMEVFNILPITFTKYNFHLHTDFELESDRKNLDATLKRNLELRELIVDAFHNALDSFWRHPTLCYDWPMFLPSPEKNDKVFWDGLDTAFREKSSYIVVECRRDSMRTMQDAMFLPESMRDKDGKPLLDDPDRDLFLSSNYSDSAVEALKNHGLKTLGFDALVALLEKDLKREDSKMKAKGTSDEWHSQMASLLSSFARIRPSYTETLKGLPLVPLENAIYMTGTDHPYSPGSLLPTDEFPDLFFHRTISEACVFSTGLFAPTWREWLCESIGVRKEITLLPEIGFKPLEILEHIYKYRPDKFLGFLKYRWGHEGGQLGNCDTLILFLRDFPAEDICLSDFPVKFKNTWLPDRDLEMIVKRYVDDLSYFPFLKIERDDTSQSIKVEWDFLTRYILTKNDQDMELFIELVESMKRLCTKDVSESQFRSMVDLYSEIDTMLTEPRKGRNERALFFTQRGCNPQQMQTLEELFHKKMGIRNATLDDLVTELTELRNAGCEDVPRIVNIYQYLDEKIDASSELRVAFQESPLLFQISDGCSSWKKTADFVWVHDETGTELAASYTKLKRFFIFKIGVKVSSEELLKSPPKDVKEAKEILAVLNNMQFFTRPLFPEGGHISEKVMFPVRYPDGRVLLENSHSDFYSNFLIGDREALKDRLKNKIKLLDLELGEVCRLRSLFWKLNLESKYLSRSVVESTSVASIDESSVISGKRDLRHKAYHVTRIAATYNSSRYLHNESAFYEQLRNMRTIGSDRISSTLKVRQESNLIQSEAALGTACAHIAENGGGLTVYVPKNAKAQEICYLSRLPEAFVKWFWLSPVGNEELVKVLTLAFATDKAILNDVLDDQGIAKLSFEDKDGIENGSSDGEEEYFDVEEPKSSKDHAPDSQTVGKDTQKATSTQPGVFDFNDLKSALPSLDRVDKSLPAKGGLFGNY